MSFVHESKQVSTKSPTPPPFNVAENLSVLKFLRSFCGRGLKLKEKREQKFICNSKERPNRALNFAEDFMKIG